MNDYHLRPEKLFPKLLRDELLRLASVRVDWMTTAEMDGPYPGDGPSPGLSPDDDPSMTHYNIVKRVEARPWLRRMCTDGASWMGMLSASRWLHDGPKVFRLSAGQREALANVEVKLMLSEYRQPFPAVLVETEQPPFRSALVYHDPDCMTIVISLMTPDNLDDIITTGNGPKCNLERTISKFDPEARTHSGAAHKATRIALNACLALTHYGCEATKALFPGEQASDRGLVARGGKSAAAAADRLLISPNLVTFSQEVVLHKERRATPAVDGQAGDSGREMSTHWRRGHWAKMACGVGRADRRLVFRRPVLVRADLFSGEGSATSVTYKI
jgi:hypothetical protein